MTVLSLPSDFSRFRNIPEYREGQTTPRLRDFVYWLPLAVESSSRNLKQNLKDFEPFVNTELEIVKNALISLLTNFCNRELHDMQNHLTQLCMHKTIFLLQGGRIAELED